MGGNANRPKLRDFTPLGVKDVHCKSLSGKSILPVKLNRWEKNFDVKIVLMTIEILGDVMNQFPIPLFTFLQVEAGAEGRRPQQDRPTQSFNRSSPKV